MKFNMNKNKQCRICKESLSFEDFYKDKNFRNGTRSECKRCTKNRVRKYAEKHKDEKKEYMQRYAKINSESIAKSKKNYNLSGHGLWVNFFSKDTKKLINISEEDFLTWYESSPKVCFYCESSLEESLQLMKYLDINIKRYRLEIDKKVPSLGYSKGNLVLACNPCNFAKKDFFTSSDFKEIAMRYIEPKVKNAIKISLKKSN